MKTTIDHDEIKNWVIKVSGRPAIIDHPHALGDHVGIRIDFPGSQDKRLLGKNGTKNATWDEFFSIFDNEKLAFVYKENPKDDDPTMWYRFDNRKQ